MCNSKDNPTNSHDSMKSTTDQNSSETREGEINMFDLMNLDRSLVRDEHVDVEKGLSRFLEETGTDFFDLVKGKQLRIKTLVDGVDNHDTDQDEEEIQQTYGSLQHMELED